MLVVSLGGARGKGRDAIFALEEGEGAGVWGAELVGVVASGAQTILLVVLGVAAGRVTVEGLAVVKVEVLLLAFV